MTKKKEEITSDVTPKLPLPSVEKVFKKPSDILLDAQDKIKQTTGRLCSNWWNHETQKYEFRMCALGVLGFEAGIRPEHMLGDSDIYSDSRHYDEADVAEKYFSPDDVYMCPVKDCNFTRKVISPNDLSSYIPEPRPLMNLIPHLNDEHYWSFTRIGEWLKTVNY